MSDSWPAHCIKPSSCARHSACMYAQSKKTCPHHGHDLGPDIEAARLAKEQEREWTRERYSPMTPPAAPAEALDAGNAFRETLLDRADAHVGSAPLWHGWAIMDAFLAGYRHAFAQPPAPAVPEGWKLVPVEPTRRMTQAAARTSLTPTEYADKHRRYGARYRAMLQAAPQPPEGA